MASKGIDARRQVEGKALIEELAGSGVEVQGAFWSLTEAQSVSRLVIVSPQVDSKGPRFVLRRIANILAKLGRISSFTLFDITPKSPSDPSLLLFVSAFPLIASTQESSFSDFTVDEVTIESVYVYYMDMNRIMLENEPVGHLAAE